MKKILKALLILVLIVIAAAVLLFGWLTAVEYRPAPVEPIVARAVFGL